MSTPKTVEPSSPKTIEPISTAPNRNDGLLRVKVRWAKGGELSDGEFDPLSGVIYTTRARHPVIISIHSGVAEWVRPIA